MSLIRWCSPCPSCLPKSRTPDWSRSEALAGEEDCPKLYYLLKDAVVDIQKALATLLFKLLL
jgi:hypothetical protein